MNLNVKISRLANKYNFITTAAGANSLIGSTYDKAISDIVGDFTDAEKKLMVEYGTWHREMNSKNQEELKRITRLFYSQSDEDEALSEAGDYQILKKTFVELESKYELYWSKKHQMLAINEKIISDSYQIMKTKFDRVFTELTYFYHKFQPRTPSVIDLHLIISPVERTSGRAVDEDVVSIDAPLLNDLTIRNFWLLFTHEAIHAHYETQEYKNWLREFASIQDKSQLALDMGPKNYLRELITSVFAGNGYFVEQLFDLDILAILNEKIDTASSELERFAFLRLSVSREMYPIVKEYIADKKQVDVQYLKSVWKFAEKNNPPR
jgi:hypothetical protein